MKFVPYLNFSGDCREAFDFYADVFGGEITSSTTFAGTPAENYVAPDWRDKIMNVQLRVGDLALMGTDSPPEHASGKPAGMFVAIVLPDADRGRQLFERLSEGGTVTMPFAETFWSPGYGMVTDRFGTPWMVNVE